MKFVSVQLITVTCLMLAVLPSPAPAQRLLQPSYETTPAFRPLEPSYVEPLDANPVASAYTKLKLKKANEDWELAGKRGRQQQQARIKAFSQPEKVYTKAYNSQPEQVHTKGYSYPEQVHTKTFSQPEQVHTKTYNSHPEQVHTKAYSYPEQVHTKAYSYPEQVHTKAYSHPEQVHTKAFSQSEQVHTKAYSDPGQASTEFSPVYTRTSSKKYSKKSQPDQEHAPTDTHLEPENAASHHAASTSWGGADESAQDGSRIQFHVSGHKGPKSYRFGYDTGKGPHRQFRYEERDGHGMVHGRYGYHDKHGQLTVYHYSAHPHHGFHVSKADPAHY